MSMVYMVKAMHCKVGSPIRKLVLIKLADNANDKGECWPSYNYIADVCEVSRRVVMSHVNSLCEMGYLEKKSRKGAKGNSTNLYTLTIPKGELDSPPPSERNSLPSELDSPPPSESGAPGISHSFESVSETVTPNTSTSQAKRDKFADQINEIFNHWRETMGKDSRAKLNKKRESAIRARLKDGFTVDEICLAITGCAKSAFHMGQNDEGKVYDDLALICRDDGKLNMFMKIKEKPAKTGEQDKAGFYQQLASKRFYDE